MEQILMHELAHLERMDPWMRFLQRLVEALLFFQPVALWCGRRLDLEREIACDDRVIALSANCRSYAKLLTFIAELAYSNDSIEFATGVIQTKSQLTRRIEMMLNRNRNRTLAVSRFIVVAVAACMAGMIFFFSQISPLVAVTQEPLEMQEARNDLNQAINQVQSAEKELWAAADVESDSNRIDAAAQSMESARREVERAREQMRWARERARAKSAEQLLLAQELNLQSRHLQLQAEIRQKLDQLKAYENELLLHQRRLIESERALHSAKECPVLPEMMPSAPAPPAIPQPELTPIPESGPIPLMTPRPQVPGIKIPSHEKPVLAPKPIQLPEIPAAPELSEMPNSETVEE
jgi:hypothetical protein